VYREVREQMVEKQVVDVVVINNKEKKINILLAVNKHGCCCQLKIQPLKKRVLENTEVTLLSYYNQDGTHSAVKRWNRFRKMSDILNIGENGLNDDI
jgi:hypothetical protein